MTPVETPQTQPKTLRSLQASVIALALLVAASAHGAGVDGARWSLRYERGCASLFGMYEPVLSSDGGSFSFCQARFELSTGRYLGPAPGRVLAALADGRVLRTDGEDLELADISGTVAVAASRIDQRSFAVAPGGQRLIAVERTGDTSHVVIRDLPHLAVARRLAVECSRCQGAVAARGADWFAFVDRSRVYLLNHASAKPVAIDTLPHDLVEVRLSPRGDAALIARADRTRAIVAIPSGTVLLELPTERGDLEFAVDRDRIAVTTHDSLRLFVRRGAGFVEAPLASEQKLHAAGAPPRFADDGHLLVVPLDALAVAVLAEGPPISRPSPSYEVNARGFVAQPLTPSPSHADDARVVSAPLIDPAAYGLIGRWSGPPGPFGAAVEVRVFACARDQLDGLDLRHWAEAALWRFVAEELSPETRFWQDAGARQLAWHDARHIIRIAERGQFIYRIEIDVPHGAPTAEAVRDFIEAPFGPIPSN